MRRSSEKIGLMRSVDERCLHLEVGRWRLIKFEVETSAAVNGFFPERIQMRNNARPRTQRNP